MKEFYHLHPALQENEPLDNEIIDQSNLSVKEDDNHGEESLCWIVSTEEDGVRLDVFLAKYCHLFSRTRLQHFIEAGHVWVDDCVEKERKIRLKPGQVCELKDIPEALPSVLIPHKMDLKIYYEDEDLLVVEKPAGLVVHPGAGHHDITLVHGLLAHCTHLSGISGIQKPGIVHRLDKDTSGLILVAKNDFTHQKLSKQFEMRTMDKRYWAFVWGEPNPPFGKISTQLARDTRHRLKQAVVLTGGRDALTGYRLLKTSGDVSLLECRLHTGRTHQIRVHCAYLGHPIVGDVLYGGGRGHSRQALHAFKITFMHPRLKKEMTFSSPLPDDLSHF